MVIEAHAAKTSSFQRRLEARIIASEFPFRGRAGKTEAGLILLGALSDVLFAWSRIADSLENQS